MILRSRHLLLAALGLTLTAAGAVLPSCEAGDSAQFTSKLSSTVAVGLHTDLAIQLPFALEITGHPSLDEIQLHADFVMTASTSSAAERLAHEVKLEIDEESSDQILTYVIRPPNQGVLSGRARLRIPSYMSIQAQVTAGNVGISDVEGVIQVAAANTVAILDARADVAVGTQSGSILIDTRLLPGTQVLAQSGRGDIEIALPARPSAVIDATVADTSEVIINHAELPQPIGPNAGSRYQAEIRGGAALVQVLTEAGRILFRQR